METFQAKLKDYARLLIQRGLGVQEGQLVLIYLEADQTLLGELLVEEAYEAGASEVRVEFSHGKISRLQKHYESVEVLGSVRPWEIAKLEERLEKVPGTLYIDSSDPDGMKGLDVQKLQAARQARYPILKPYQDKLENQYPWCIAAAAGEAWAKKVFPDLPIDEAVAQLWEAIFAACRVTGNGDALANWDEHLASFAARSAWLNDQKFTKLHYQSDEGTDFTCWLSPDIRWEGGDETSDRGHVFSPNLPTEEIFSAPVAGRAEGVLHATMPLSSQGQLVEDFWIKFEGGEAVDWGAKSGREVLTSLPSMDEGAKRLGEVALVPQDSPIAASGVLFYNTLFDENASCHFAIGSAYSNLLEGYEGLSSDELQARGINQSMVHTDFMVGSPSLSIDGYRADGTVVPVFREGTWAE